MRARTARSSPASYWVRSECWQFQRRSIIARNFSLPLLRRAARRPTKFANPMPREVSWFPHLPSAPRAVLSTWCRIASPYARVRIHRVAQTLTECSNCEQTRAPMLLLPQACSADRPPVISYYTRPLSPVITSPTRLSVPLLPMQNWFQRPRGDTRRSFWALGTRHCFWSILFEAVVLFSFPSLSRFRVTPASPNFG